MSFDIFVYCDRLPTAHEWHDAIIAEGMPLDLDATLDLATHSGFWPAHLNGKLSGFELYNSSRRDRDDMEPATNYCISLSAGAGNLEINTAALAAIALCRLTGGILVDPQPRGGSYAADDVANWWIYRVLSGDQPAT